MTPDETKRVVEAALLCAPQPLHWAELTALFDGRVDDAALRAALDALVADWSGRGLELVEVAGGWRFQSRGAMREFLDRLRPDKPAKYSRAALETLAIVAYRQPVTRGDIEDIRGVTVSTGVVRHLEERGWIEAIGHREAPGRPALYATTRRFLDDLGLPGLDALPALPAPGAAGDAAAASDGVDAAADATVPGAAPERVASESRESSELPAPSQA